MKGLPRCHGVAWVLGLSALGGSALADAAPPPRPSPRGGPDAKDAATPEKKDPEVLRIKDTRPRRLPDGVFSGRLEGAGIAAELRVTIVAGRVTEAVMRRDGGLPVLDLIPVEAGDSIDLRLLGSHGSEFVRINGSFFDTERGAGRFDGVLGRVQTAGTWLLARR